MTTSQPGQPGHPSASRALPDAIDLRLLAALTGSGGSVGLPQAAWNAGIPQADAAARLVQLAESGFPLRLVAEGDARLLHQVIERGPVVPPTPPPSPPLGTGAGSSPRDVGAGPGAATWGLPGSAAWARREQPASTPATGPTAAQPGPDGAPTSPGPAAAGQAPAGPTSAGPAARVGQAQGTVGLAGERLSVTVSQIIDPASEVLATAGYVLDPGERAVMVRSAITNQGPAPHDCMPDLYLVLVAAGGAVLQKAPVSVAGYPAHRVGVTPGGSSDGWTVFLIGAEVAVEAARWSVRPDLVDRTLNWSTD